jgi:translation elongation factor EF-Ts
MATPTTEGPTVEDTLKGKIAKIGENMVIPRFARMRRRACWAAMCTRALSWPCWWT